MLACTALVGCTNEDPVENSTNQESTQKVDAYMAVKLMLTESRFSRATDDGGYDKGVENEQWIKGANSIFLFYDANGKWVTSGELMDEQSLQDGKDGAHHDATEGDINDLQGNAYVVLSGTTEGLKNKITQVLTVVNYSVPASLKRLDLDEALKTIANVDTEKLTNGKQPTFGYLMTTSVYSGKDKEGKEVIVNTTAIDKDIHIKATQDEAKKSPVEIYIERAAAKVQLAYTLNNTTTTIVKGGTEIPVESDKNTSIGDEAGGQDGNDITIDGKQYPAYISIEGWTVNNVNDETYLIKKAQLDWNTTNPLLSGAWSNASDFRSYWAEGTKWEYSGSPTITSLDNHKLTSYSYNDAIATDNSGNLSHLYNNAMYCYEQTIESPKNDKALKGIDYPNVTTVLIAAKIKINDLTTGGVRDAGTLYKYGGVFYTEPEYKEVIAKQIQDAGYMIYTAPTGEGEAATSASYTSIPTSMIDVVSNRSTLDGVQIVMDITGDVVKDVKGKVENGVTEYTHVASSKADVEAFLNGKAATENEEAIPANQYVSDVEGYKDGACYYQIPIEHLSSTGGNEGGQYLYGVVRNHWYKLNISKIIRIGEGVFDPDKLIPQIPAEDTSYYMAAKLHVLNWHVVDQDVTLD